MKERALQIIAVAAYWLNYGGSLLKKDTRFYKKKNAELLDAFLLNNRKSLEGYEKTKVLFVQDPVVKKNLEEHFKKLTGRETVYSKEAIEDDLNMMQDIFNVFLNIYMFNSTYDLVNFYIVLKTLEAKKPVFTSEEVLAYMQLIKSGAETVDGVIDKVKNHKYDNRTVD